MDITTARTSPLWWGAVDATRMWDSLAGDIDVDVAIIGAGFTGLWSAYYLSKLDPSLRIAVVEKDHVGFGASGRNGGWCHAEYPLGHEQLVKDHGRDAAMRHMRALFASVDDVGRVTQDEGIDCDFQKGGVLTLRAASCRRAMRTRR
jgi:glycine/D-amino acid oxidase-like deaminating enzyme